MIPLPNDRTRDGATVVASVAFNDDDPTAVVALLLLLHPVTPYYEVREVMRDGIDGPWRTIADHGFHPNIVPAVEAYEANGGDY